MFHFLPQPVQYAPADKYRVVSGRRLYPAGQVGFSVVFTAALMFIYILPALYHLQAYLIESQVIGVNRPVSDGIVGLTLGFEMFDAFQRIITGQQRADCRVSRVLSIA